MNDQLELIVEGRENQIRRGGELHAKIQHYREMMEMYAYKKRKAEAELRTILKKLEKKS